MTVYIVDDDQRSREIACSCVVSAGFAVKAYSSGEEFLSEFDPTDMGCIVSDYQMDGGMSGLDIQKNLARKGHVNPMVFVSGYADIGVAVKAMRRGALNFLQKPYSAKALINAVEEAANVAIDIQEANHKLNELTHGEVQVMWLMISGLPNKAVASRLGVGLRTVERRRHEIFRKTGTQSEVQVNELVRRAGWERPEDLA